MNDIKHQLEIALTIERKSCRQLARDWSCTDAHIWGVAQGKIVSKRMRRKVEDFIKKAKKAVPFEYPEQELAA